MRRSGLENNDTYYMRLPSDISLKWLTYDPEEARRLIGLLSEEERERLESFRLGKRRREFLLGRAAARLLLADCLSVSPEKVPLLVADDGAVEVPEGSLTVSIAHSGPHAVAAVGERPVGVDLEGIRQRHPGLSRFLLAPGEQKLFDTLPLDRTRAHILYWTLKEATLKAMRTGLRLSPKKLRLNVDLETQSAIVHVEAGELVHARFDERHGYYLAVAYREEKE